MSNITTTALLLVLSIGSIQCVNWSNITATELKNLPTSAFQSITADELSSIPPEACQGFQQSQVSALNSSAASGLKAACLAQFPTNKKGGCSGLQAEFVGLLKPQAISGLQADCIRQTPNRAFSQVSSEQLAALTDSSCSGFLELQVQYLPPSAAPGLKVGCLANFSSGLAPFSTHRRYGGCRGLQGPFVGKMTPSTFEGFREDCIAFASSSTFENISSTQMSHIPPPSFRGLSALTFFNIPDEAWTGVSKLQLTYLSQFAFQFLRASVLKILVNMYTLDIVNIFTVEQFVLFPLTYAAEFKSFIPSQVPFLTEWDTISKDLSSVTWLKIALLKKSDQSAVLGPVFNAEIIQSLPFSAFRGLRVDHVPLIAAADFKLFNETHTHYFTSDTVSAISADQLRELSPVAFGEISPFSISGLNPQVMSAITSNQVRYLTRNQIQAMSCKQLQAFSMDQLSNFNEYQQKNFFSTYEAQCGVLAPPFTTAPMYSAAEIFLIVAGVILAVVVVGCAIFYFVRKQRADPTRQPLLN